MTGLWAAVSAAVELATVLAMFGMFVAAWISPEPRQTRSTR